MTDTEKQKTLGEKLASTLEHPNEKELAAWRREDHLRALKEERAGLVAAGKDERVKAVDAEIDRVSGKPQGRTTPDTGSSSSSSSGGGRVKQADVPDGDPADVLNWVGTDKARAKVALAVENKKNADDRRDGLIEKLTEIEKG